MPPRKTQSSSAQAQLDLSVEGVVSKVHFASPDGFHVLTANVNGQDLRMVGVMPPVDVGQRIHATGRHAVDPKWGPQFKVESAMPAMPSTLEGLTKYIGAKFVKGVGPTMAANIVKAFGDKTEEALGDARQLVKIRGISAELAQQIAATWEKKRAVSGVMAYLREHGASPALAGRIFEAYGGRSVEVLSSTPYQLAVDVDGVGFTTADQLAMSVGISRESPARASAAILHVLREESSNGGHTWVERSNLVRLALKVMKVEEGADSDMPATTGRAINDLDKTGLVVVEERLDHEGPFDVVFTARLHKSEEAVAERFAELRATTAPNLTVDVDAVIRQVEQKFRIKLADAQRDAVLAAAENKTLVITGAPGTGKTTILKTILAIFDAAKLTVKLAAPTGRAAKRMTESTGKEATTIHRLLEYVPGIGFTRGRSTPIDADVVILDEASMIDTRLAESLLNAVADRSRLFLVGDVDQLPSVGPGAVLRDVIQSGFVPTVRLTRIFRQAEGSGISVAAAAVNHGQLPEITEGEFEMLMAPDAPSAAAAVIDLVSTILPNRFGIRPIEDVQVMSPMRKGEAGTYALNKALQNALNPHAPDLAHGLRLGDKVMQLRNNYDLDIFNGDIGFVQGLHGDELTVDFDGRLVNIPDEDLDDLALAYASTIHKCQGSSAKVVVLVMLTAQYIMLQRSLLYTGITRGEKHVTLVTDQRALRTATRQRAGSRNTGLMERLRGWRAAS